MYSNEDRIRAVEAYIKPGKRVRFTIRQLGCPTKNFLKGWYNDYQQKLDLPAGYAARAAKSSKDRTRQLSRTTSLTTAALRPPVIGLPLQRDAHRVGSRGPS